jgi:hypothetical protein
MVPVLVVVAVSSVVGDKGDDDGDDVPSVSLEVLVVLALAFAAVAVAVFASVPSRTISQGRQRKGVSYVLLSCQL